MRVEHITTHTHTHRGTVQPHENPNLDKCTETKQLENLLVIWMDVDFLNFVVSGS